jgi:hypothetical protein
MKCRRTSRKHRPVEMRWQRLCESMNPERLSHRAHVRYNNLFEWIVSRVNVSMKPQSASEYVIGVLDI